MERVSRWIFDKDHFAINPNLNIKGKRYSTVCGVLLTGLIFSLLLAYFIQGFYYSFAVPVMSSTLIQGSMNERLDLSSLRICMDISLKSDLPENFSLKDYLAAVTFADRQHVPTSIHSFVAEDGSNWPANCVKFTEKAELQLKHTLALDFARNFTVQEGTYFRFVFYFYELSYDDKDQRTPLQYQWAYIFNEHEEDAVKSFYFDKIAYEVETSPIFSPLAKFDGMRLTRTEKTKKDENPFLAAQVPYLFTYSGLTVVNQSAYTKLIPLVAEVFGLYGLFILLSKLFFKNYFEYKFMENLFNQVQIRKGKQYVQDEEMPMHTQMSEERNLDSPTNKPVKSVKPVEIKKLEVNYFAYLCGNLLAKKSATITQLKVWKAHMKEQLDVVNFIQKQSL